MAISIFWMIIGFLFLLFISGIKIIEEYTRGVVLRFGKYKRVLQPGFRWIIPIVDHLFKVDIRIRTIDVEPQEIISKDTVPVTVDAVIFYKVIDVKKSILEVREYEKASVKLAQTILRDIVGQSELDELLAKKEELGNKIKTKLDKETDAWGISVTNVEIKDVNLPDNLKRAMARESEATREKRARIIKAEGELEASKKLNEASIILAKSKHGLALRQLQTWQEIGAEQNSLMIVIPSDMNLDPVALSALGKDYVIKKKGK